MPLVALGGLEVILLVFNGRGMDRGGVGGGGNWKGEEPLLTSSNGSSSVGSFSLFALLAFQERSTEKGNDGKEPLFLLLLLLLLHLIPQGSLKEVGTKNNNNNNASE